MRLFGWVCVVLVGACGGAQRADESGPSCDMVADHLVELAVMDNEATGAPPNLQAAGDDLKQQCESAPWSEERRTCLAEAKHQEATLECPVQ